MERLHLPALVIVASIVLLCLVVAISPVRSMERISSMERSSSLERSNSMEADGENLRLPPNMLSDRFFLLTRANGLVDRIKADGEFSALRSVDFITHGAGYTIEQAARSALNLPDLTEQAIIEPLAPFIYKRHFGDPCGQIIPVFDRIGEYLEFIISHDLFFKYKAEKLKRFGIICKRLVDPDIKAQLIEGLRTYALTPTQPDTSGGHGGPVTSSPSTPKSPAIGRLSLE